MNLCFYSGGTKKQNHELTLKLKEFLPTDAKITYLPSSSDLKRKYFNDFKDWFGYYGYHNFTYFDLDTEYSPCLTSELLNSDAIYLSGGNTFHFLYSIRRRKLIKTIRDLARKGKFIVGLSAGSCIMTPSISFAAFYHTSIGDIEELNYNNLVDFTSLNLVAFEFVPHYSKGTKGESVVKYQQICKNPMYLCPDGSDVLIHGNEEFVIGHISKIKNSTS